jgi:hypothetical protein
MDAYDWRELANQVARTPIDWALIEPHIAVSKRGYTRVRLAQTDVWEMLLIGWLPGQGSSIHGHGGSAGITRLVMGSLREARFERSDSEHLVCASRRAISECQAIVEETQTIHRMSNEDEEPALSLHLYSPPLRALVEYDPIELVVPEHAVHL